MSVQKRTLTPNPQAEAPILGDEKLAATSPYARHEAQKQAKTEKQSSPKPKAKGKDSDPEKQLLAAQQALASLKEAEARRKEFTPTFRVNETSLAAVYVGKVAGKTTPREMAFVNHENAALLMPLLRPIMAVMNAALRSQQLEPKTVKGPKGKPARLDNKVVFEANALTRASVAYDAILSSDEVCEKLKELNALISRLYAEKGVDPRDVKHVVERTPLRGSKSTAGYTAVDYLDTGAD